MASALPPDQDKKKMASALPPDQENDPNQKKKICYVISTHIFISGQIMRRRIDVGVSSYEWFVNHLPNVNQTAESLLDQGAVMVLNSGFATMTLYNALIYACNTRNPDVRLLHQGMQFTELERENYTINYPPHEMRIWYDDPSTISLDTEMNDARDPCLDGFGVCLEFYSAIGERVDIAFVTQGWFTHHHPPDRRLCHKAIYNHDISPLYDVLASHDDVDVRLASRILDLPPAKDVKGAWIYLGNPDTIQFERRIDCVATWHGLPNRRLARRTVLYPIYSPQ